MEPWARLPHASRQMRLLYCWTLAAYGPSGASKRSPQVTWRHTWRHTPAGRLSRVDILGSANPLRQIKVSSWLRHLVNQTYRKMIICKTIVFKEFKICDANISIFRFHILNGTLLPLDFEFCLDFVASCWRLCTQTSLSACATACSPWRLAP